MAGDTRWKQVHVNKFKQSLFVRVLYFRAFAVVLRYPREAAAARCWGCTVLRTSYECSDKPQGGGKKNKKIYYYRSYAESCKCQLTREGLEHRRVTAIPSPLLRLMQFLLLSLEACLASAIRRRTVSWRTTSTPNGYSF